MGESRARSLPRIDGEGWAVWRDADGIVVAADKGPLDAMRAAERAAACEGFLAAPVRGLLVFDEAGRPGGPETWETYASLVASHPTLPVAVASREPETLRRALLLRGAMRPAALEVFGSADIAHAWLRARPVTKH